MLIAVVLVFLNLALAAAITCGLIVRHTVWADPAHCRQQRHPPPGASLGQHAQQVLAEPPPYWLVDLLARMCIVCCPM